MSFMDHMTPRERWLAVLQRATPDRLPMDYWATPEATANVMRYLGCASLDEVVVRLHIDRPIAVAPRFIGPPVAENEDYFGCRFQRVAYSTGVYDECVYHPLAGFQSIEEIDANYTFPSPDWFDYSVIPDQIKGKERYPVRGGGSEPFLRYTELRGLAQAYVDLVENPDLVTYCLDKLFDLAYEDTCRIYETIPGQVTLSYVAEDFGSQENLLFSPCTIREMFIPRMKRMIDLAHEAGAYVIHHSDGAIRPIIPDMIDAGIDILNPIQWRCKGMDRADLKRDFGDSVIFHGGVDNQQTLSFGTVDEVRAEVIENIRILGDGGGYILAPCHNIQAISPPENIVALYETGYAYGKG
jgi:uroporphyrinogen decarboxylase